MRAGIDKGMNWVCLNWVCQAPNPPGCPTNPPQPGNNCTLGAGLVCNWGNLACTCVNNNWFCN